MINVSVYGLFSILDIDLSKVEAYQMAQTLEVVPFDTRTKSGVFSFSKAVINREYIDYSKSILIIFSTENSIFYDDVSSNILIYTMQPRDLFFNCLSELIDNKNFDDNEYVRKCNGSYIHMSAQVSQNSIIGDNTIIHSNSVIYGNVKIGKNCVIGPGTIIGYSGFGLVKNSEGNNIKFPHLGGVLIQDHCNIGALNTIASGTLEPTVIGQYTCTDDHVHIAHNVSIGSNCTITACAEISGSVTLEDCVWVGPNSSIKNGINIGANALIGIGSNILKDVSRNRTVVGNPGKEL